MIDANCSLFQFSNYGFSECCRCHSEYFDWDNFERAINIDCHQY